MSGTVAHTCNTHSSTHLYSGGQDRRIKNVRQVWGICSKILEPKTERQTDEAAIERTTEDLLNTVYLKQCPSCCRRHLLSYQVRAVLVPRRPLT